MKNKEVKECLKTAYEDLSNPNFNSDLISKLEIARLSQKKDEVRNQKAHSKWLIPSLSGAFACLAIVLITVFTLPGQTSINSTPSSILNPNQLPLTKAKSVIGNEIILASILTDNEKTSTLKMARLAQDDYESNVYLIHDYLVTGEMLLNKQDVTMEIYYNDNQDYSYYYKMVINYIDAFNNSLDYIFYYNETPLEYDSDDDHDEISITFDGIIIIDNFEYHIEGTRENEENEEFSIETTISLNNQKIVTIEQETENDENGLEYTLYKNKQEVYSTEIEYEIHNNRIKYSFEEEHKEEREYEFIVSLKDNETIVTAIIEESRNERRVDFKVVTDENGIRDYIFEE